MRRATLAAVCLLLLTTRSAYALNPALDVSQYVHTSWRAHDGFSSGAILAIAQTTDGYLWVGTETGLLRFDGVRFFPWKPPPGQRLPSNAIAGLLGARDGTLWIGTETGLASWKNGTLTVHETLAGSVIAKLVEDGDGSIWLTRFIRTKWTLCTIRQRRTQCFGEDGGPGAGAIGLYQDSRSRLWVGTFTGLWQWQPGPPRFTALPPEENENGIQGFAEDDAGQLLLSKAGAVRRLVAEHLELAYPLAAHLQRTQAHRMLRDRDGGLWVGGSSAGLVHVHQGLTDAFARRDGLAGDSVSSIFEDQEGSVWVATTDGLDRFRDAPVASYSVNQGLSNSRTNSVLAATDGSLWIATFAGLDRLTDSEVTIYRERSGLPSIGSVFPVSRHVREITGVGLPAAGVQAIFQDTRGRVWISTGRGVGYFQHDRFVPVSGLPGGLTRAIVEDHRRNLWIVNRDVGLFRVSPDGNDVELIWNGADRIMAMAVDPSKGGLWLGFFRGGISYLEDGQIRASYGAADGLAEGRVTALHTARDGTLWAATVAGLSRLKDGRVRTLTSRDGLPCDSAQWALEGGDRSLWVSMSCGLVHISRADIDAWVSAANTPGGPTPRVHATVYDGADGVRVFLNAVSYGSPATTSADGKVWFTSQEGVSVLDPRRLPFNRRPPPVHIEQVTADRHVYDPRSGLRLPPLVRDLQIDYTALSLAAPERNQFRIMLEGHDRDWQDVGVRRQAIYNDLRPGHYRFRVRASNNNGVWNEAGATLAFSVAPAYYQTTWFLALSVGLVVAAVWAAHRVRLRVVEKHGREITALNERLMKAQEQERTRIAGELHDGVMQEMLAVTMMLGTAKRRIPDEAEGKATIDKAQQKLIQLGTDLRQLSHELHPPALQEAGLPGAVRAYCEEFSVSSGVPITCDADEEAHELSRGAALALFRILQEALGNAAKHAHATRITVRLTHSDGLVSLVVSDDGAGFDRAQQGTSRGLGLITIRERASQLGGTFDVESAPGRGTTIRVAVPFR